MCHSMRGADARRSPRCNLRSDPPRAACFFFLNDPPPTKISPLPLRDSLPIYLLDALDFFPGAPPVLALAQPPEPHRPVGDPVQPLHLETQRLREPPDDALATFRQGDLDLDEIGRAHV